MTSLADIEQRLRRSPITAAQICHAGNALVEVGDVSWPVDVRRMS